jgi:hypothetical protein
MELTWTVPVVLIAAATVYAVFVRYFAHKERLARLSASRTEEGPDDHDN